MRSLRLAFVGLLLIALCGACGLDQLGRAAGSRGPSASSPVLAPAVQLGDTDIRHGFSGLSPRLWVECTLLNNSNSYVTVTVHALVHRRSGTQQDQRLVQVPPGRHRETFEFGADVEESEARGECRVLTN